MLLHAGAGQPGFERGFDLGLCQRQHGLHGLGLEHIDHRQQAQVHPALQAPATSKARSPPMDQPSSAQRPPGGSCDAIHCAYSSASASMSKPRQRRSV